MEKKIGFIWSVNFWHGYYQPTEEVFPTMEECEESIAEYSQYPRECICIQKAEEDDGWVTVLETIKEATEEYAEPDEFEDEEDED